MASPRKTPTLSAGSADRAAGVPETRPAPAGRVSGVGGSTPSIGEAKGLCRRHRSRGVLILTFSGGGYSATSYGIGRAECEALAAISEQLGDLIEGELIEIPNCLGAP